MEKKRIVVTGGAGFVGSNLLPHLLQRDNHVVVFDNFSNGKMENLQDVKDNPNLEIIKGDVRHADEVKRAFRGAQVVLHLCCQGVRQAIKDPYYVNDVIVDGTLNCLEAAVENKVDLFFNVSSIAVYGKAKYFPVDEEHQMFPVSAYGVAKAAQDLYVRSYGVFRDLPWLTLRFTAMYGPRSHWESYSGEVIPRMVIRAMNREPLIVFGEGTQTRDFLYVGDAVKAILALLDAPGAKGEIFNYGSTTETSILEIAEKICRHFDIRPEAGIQKLPMRPGDSAKVVCDHAKFKARMGFGPETGMNEGLQKTIEWFESLPYPREKLLADVAVKNWE